MKRLFTITMAAIMVMATPPLCAFATIDVIEFQTPEQARQYCPHPMDLTFHANSLPNVTSGSSNSYFASSIYDSEPTPKNQPDMFGKIVGASFTQLSKNNPIYGRKYDFGRIDCYYKYPNISDANHMTWLLHMPKPN